MVNPSINAGKPMYEISSLNNFKNENLNLKNEISISFFKSVTDKNPVNQSILNVLNQIKSETLKLKIEKLRLTLVKSERELLKKQLPCITVSGIFKNGHSSKDLKQHSGLIQVDFDSV